MPLYEYRCNACSRAFELLMRSDEVPRCPQCQGEDLSKQFSVFAVGAQPGGTRELPSPCRSCKDPSGPCALAG